jgi:quercetin dioxygenase-like cupin family protein
MRHERIDQQQQKGLSVGPWNSALAVAIGWATVGIDAPHEHTRMTEIFLVARGTATAHVEGRAIALAAGDILSVEPGEAHTFSNSSADYCHFVVHTPALSPTAARADHRPVPRARLGLA